MLINADVGKNISVQARYTDGHGTLESLTSAATAAVLSSNGALLFSTAGKDFLTGTSSNNDTVSYANANATATAGVTVSLAITTQQNTIGAGRDTITDIENLIGSNYNDNLRGNFKTNILDGGAGNDILNGGPEADTLIGGLGDDTFVIDNVNGIVIENSNEGVDLVRSSASYVLPANVENLNLIGTLAINGTGNDLANIITGNANNNELIGANGNDTLIGGDGDHTLDGGAGNDSMQGGMGVYLYS